MSARMASFNERLVLQVKKHKKLWDHCSTLQKESKKREAAWMDVAAELIATVEKCRTRWRTLRDSYIKLKRRQRSRSRGQWDLLEHELRFLDEHLRPPRRRHLRKMVVATEPRDCEKPRHASEAPPTEDVEEERAAAVMAGAATMPELYHLFDGDELFCLCLAANLKRLPLRQRMLTKIKLLQILHEAEFGPGDV
ncbi:uncharacterized protein LOC144143012 [Haemaphysalis longicornis]